MVTADDLRPLRTAPPDYEGTEKLKADFLALRRTRSPFLLTAEEMDLVFRWKLGQQYGRGKATREANPPVVYKVVTRACFGLSHTDLDYEARVRIGVLTAIPGVGVPIASAVLALTEPARYCVIDFRGWRAVYDEDRTSFTVTDYLKYRSAVSVLAVELGWGVQETDYAIWELDRRRGRPVPESAQGE